MDEKEDLKNQLKGMSNYIDWFHRFKQECYLNDWLLQTGDYSADIVKIKAIKKHMMKTISNQAIGYFDVLILVYSVIQSVLDIRIRTLNDDLIDSISFWIRSTDSTK
jgi:TFIIF-interacting CTD phosphatase-like protein